MGPDIGFQIIPLVIGGIFVFVLGVILFSLARAFGEWMYNNGQPIETKPARVISKRSELQGAANSAANHHIRTYYYVTFEFEDGDRKEFYVRSNEYGLLTEGDQGKLTYQGTRYHRFDRDR
jgi:hypothetical protein